MFVLVLLALMATGVYQWVKGDTWQRRDHGRVIAATSGVVVISMIWYSLGVLVGIALIGFLLYHMKGHMTPSRPESKHSSKK